MEHLSASICLGAVTIVGIVLVWLGAAGLQGMHTVQTKCLTVSTFFSPGSEYGSSSCTFRALYFSSRYNATAGPQTLVKADANRFDNDKVLCLAQNYRHGDNETVLCWHTRSESSVFDLYEMERSLIVSLRNSANWMIGIGSVLLLPCLISMLVCAGTCVRSRRSDGDYRRV